MRRAARANAGASTRRRARGPRRFWVGVILLLFVIGLIIWGLFSAEDDEDTGDFYEEYDDMY